MTGPRREGYAPLALPRHSVDRRAFLQRLAQVAGAAALPFPLEACRGCARTEEPSRARTFDRRQWALVEAAAARLVPSDDLPGAREANVVGFVDAQLAEPHFAMFRREFAEGLAALDRADFTRLGPERQDEVLAQIQDGADTARFFQLLFTFTLEGLLGDPVHGGNQGEAGWKLIGFTPRPPRPGHRHD